MTGLSAARAGGPEQKGCGGEGCMEAVKAAWPTSYKGRKSHRALPVSL